jgi:serine/threonine protein phosphatase 1
MSLTCAIGDVHGRRDLLAALLDAVEARAAGEKLRIVFLGDIIDRGPESRQALDLVIDTLSRHPASRLILGNHEEFMLRFVGDAENRLRTAELWFNNGGLETLHSYGFRQAERIDTIAARFADEFAGHLAALHAADWMIRDGGYCFVHGGVDPAVPLAEQDPETTRWIRYEFLDWRGPLEMTVVHGHTPTDSALPEVHGNRIALDTGAVYTGHLTCALLEEDAEPRFLATDDHGPRIEVAPIRPLVIR